MADFVPLSDFVAYLERSRATVMPRLEHVVEGLMLGCAERSKAMIGEEHADWAPLAESTVREKEMLGYVGHVSATDPLLRTGRLRDSIKASVVIDDYDTVTGVVSSDVPYASVQEHGDSRVPPRPFLSPPIITIQPTADAALSELAVDLLIPG